jgi:hypothetical protein
MYEPMSPETLQRLMTEEPAEAAEQELECESYSRAVQVARSLIAGLERFARQLERQLARQLELAQADDVSASLAAVRSAS